MTSEDHEAAKRHGIVVGIDGSDHSKAALAWAAEQAVLAASQLKVVVAWEYVTYGYPVPWLGNVDLAAEARSVLESTVAEVLGRESSIELTLTVTEGHPALVLEYESRSAALLVVGSRGHGEFVGMLLGSVSEFLATHARCPVVIVRGDDEG